MKRDSPGSLPDMRSPRASRLTFSFHGETIEFLTERPVAMAVMSSADLGSERPKAPFWFEVQDKQGKPLYRRFDRNPLDPWVEVTSDDPQNSIVHRRSQRLDGFFTLVVPDLENAQSIVLFGFRPIRPNGELDISVPPDEIARFTLARAIDPGAKVADSTPPTTISDTLASYVGSATIHFFASDNAGGSGVAHTYYKIDDEAQKEGDAILVNATGKHTLEFWSVDRAGNVEEPKTISFTIVPSTGKRRG